MDLSPIFQAVLDLKREGAVSGAPALRKGDRLTGRVLQIDADGRALIDLGGFRAKAQVGFPIHAGQALQLRVVQEGSPLHLQADVQRAPRPVLELPRLDFTQVLTVAEHKQLAHLMDRISNLPNVQWDKLPNATTLLEAMRHIKAVFDHLPVDKPTAQLAKWLKVGFEDRGVLFEKKLADAVMSASQVPETGNDVKANPVRHVMTRDLKPQLMALKSFLQSSTPLEMLGARIADDDLEFARHSVSKMLSHVIQQQERVVRNAREGELFQVFTHMLSFDEQRHPVQFKVFYPKREGRDPSDSPHHHIALLLNMGRLGPVRADLSMVEGHLKVRFFVSNTAVQERFERKMETLYAALGAYFDEIALVIRVSEEKIRQFDQHQQDESPLGRIDIKV